MIFYSGKGEDRRWCTAESGCWKNEYSWDLHSETFTVDACENDFKISLILFYFILSVYIWFLKFSLVFYKIFWVIIIKLSTLDRHDHNNKYIIIIKPYEFIF